MVTTGLEGVPAVTAGTAKAALARAGPVASGAQARSINIDA
jgi:hypothetical protein